MSKKKLRVRFWVESVIAVLAATLALLTLAWPDWIERVTGLEPDNGSGLLEWVIVAVLAVAAIALAVAARFEWRRIPAVA